MLFLWHIELPPIHQFFLDVNVMRLTATDPEGGTFMGVKGIEELGAGPVDNMVDGGKGRLALLDDRLMLYRIASLCGAEPSTGVL